MYIILSHYAVVICYVAIENSASPYLIALSQITYAVVLG